MLRKFVNGLEFWNIELVARTVSIEYGGDNSKVRSKERLCDSSKEAKKEFDKEISKILGKGFQEIKPPFEIKHDRLGVLTAMTCDTYQCQIKLDSQKEPVNVSVYRDDDMQAYLDLADAILSKNSEIL